MGAKRKRIRHAVVAALLGNTDAGANVFASRVLPVDPKTEVPLILIYTQSESAELFNESPRELKRTLSIRIEIVARADDGVDDFVDDVSEQVEWIMSEHQTLSGSASDVLYTGTEIEFSREGDSIYCGCTLSYDVTYFTADVSRGVEAPGVPEENVLQDFERANVRWSPNQSMEVSTEDRVELET